MDEWENLFNVSKDRCENSDAAIGHFTVVWYQTWPLNGSEVGGGLASICHVNTPN